MIDFSPAIEVADAVLFEGYLLYPYRASATKNRMRWQFGVLAPEGSPGEHPYALTECLLEAGDDAAVDIRLRFLQVRTRMSDPPWDEGVVREVDTRLDLRPLAGGATASLVHAFEVPAFDGVPDDAEDGLRRRGNTLRGAIELAAEPVPGPYAGLTRLRVRVVNHGDPPDPDMRRDDLVHDCLVAAHTLIGVRDGAFVSLLDPPQWAAGAAKQCVNEHTWPVLAGPEGTRDLVLSSPIILYDHPRTAPESPTDLFDATEIDEILTLRTFALTDEEKQEARETDPRAAAIIDHVDAMPQEMLDRLHGTVRYLREVTGDGPGGVARPDGDAVPTLRTDASGAPVRPEQPWWDPGADTSVSPETDTVPVVGGVAAKDSRVVLRPGTHRADAQDMFLAGRTATVQGVFSDVDGGTYIAVTLDDDPAADLHLWHGRFMYFNPDEVELTGGPT
jgi:hypothetical protein